MPPVPSSIDLDPAERLTIGWPDGRTDVYPLTLLRARCPCAACRPAREEPSRRRSPRLNVLPSAPPAGLPTVRAAELVGRYALKLDWADGHASGIYSFEYLRTLGREFTS